MNFPNVIHVNMEFTRVLPTFNWVMALCKNLFSWLFSLVSCDIDLRFNLVYFYEFVLICLTFDTFAIIAHQLFPFVNSVFRTFICRLLRYWHHTCMNLYWHNTEWLLYPFIYWFNQYLFKIDIQAYNYYNTWLKWFDNKIENFIYCYRSFASSKFVNTGRKHVFLQQYLQNACSFIFNLNKCIVWY